MAKTIMTKWAVRACVVSENVNEGYDVNGFRVIGERDHGVINLRLKIETTGQGTPVELTEIRPSYCQCARALGVGCKIDVYYEDTVVNVYRESDGYPFGSLYLLEPKGLRGQYFVGSAWLQKKVVPEGYRE